MKETIKVIASELANRGQGINFNVNSIFDLIESQGNNEGDYALIANKLAIGLVNDINRIRNIFIPFKNEYKKEVKELLDKTELTNKIKDYDIVSIDLPQIIRELDNRSIIERATSRREMPKDIVILDEPANIKEFINFDNELLNKLASPIISKYSDKELSNIWKMYFTNISNTNGNINELTINPLLKLDLYVILLGILTTLKSEKQLTSPGLQDSKYFNTISLFLNKVKHSIRVAINIMELNIKSNNLIYKIENGIVYVYEAVYDKFLENNSSEVLLGMAIKYKNDNIPLSAKRLDDVIVNKDKYITSWNAFIKLERVANSLKDVNRYKLAYETALVEFLKHNITDDIIDYISINSLGEIHPKINKLYSELKDSDILDVEFMVNEIMGKIVIKDTNYYHFISSMVELSKLNPDLTPEEAATMAAINLITDYVFLQLTTGRVEAY